MIRLEKINNLVDRINKLNLTSTTTYGIEVAANSHQLKHLLLCQCLNAYGIKTATRIIEIWEEYNDRKI